MRKKASVQEFSQEGGGQDYCGTLPLNACTTHDGFPNIVRGLLSLYFEESSPENHEVNFKVVI